MATKIVTKNSSTAGAAPTATDLVQGELAVNVADKRLYTEDNAGAIVELGTNPYNFTANHNGSAKLATTSTGIDVTGTATMDGLTVEGSGAGLVNLYRASANANFSAITFSNTTNDAVNAKIGWNTNELRLDGTSSVRLVTDAKNRLLVSLGGDISFYEDTGTTPKFFWDASAESLGIGTSSPARDLHIHNTTQPYFHMTSGDTGSTASDGFSIIVENNTNDVLLNQRENANIRTFVNGSERMRIDPSGNVGIGTSSPQSNLHVNGFAAITSPASLGSNANAFSFTAGANAFGLTGGVLNSGATYLQSGTTSGTATAYSLLLNPNGGNVGIGTSTPTEQLDVVGDIGLSGRFLPTSGSSATSASAPKICVGYDYDTGFFQDTTNTIGFSTAGSERMRIDSSGNVIIGSTSLSASGSVGFTQAGQIKSVFASGVANDSIIGAISGVSNGFQILQDTSNNQSYKFHNGGTPSVTIDSSGNVLVGQSATTVPGVGNTTAGSAIGSAGYIFVSKSGDTPAHFNRNTNDGDIITLRKDGTTVGSIGVALSDNLYLSGVDAGIGCGTGAIYPANTTGQPSDNDTDLGTASTRFDDIYASNGTIQTSDRNEKQDIAELSDAEQRVAVACKGLLRKFRWKDSVAEKGDEARTHFGIIAQDLQAAFAAEGLDAGGYAMFISTTWTDEETNEEKTRLGVRYSELLAFIIAAI